MSENAGHGRIEKRTCTVVGYGSIMEKMFKKKLVGLKSVVRIKSERTIVATGEYTQEVRYYVTSLDNTQPEEIAKMALTMLKNEKTTKGSMNLKRLNKFL
nr:hypothetical protein [Phocaeicola vulgatus]